MKKIVYGILVIMMVMLAVSISHAKEKNIYIVHESMPTWATQTLNGTHFWFTGQYAYGVGIAPQMKKGHLQKTTAEGRARAALITGLRIGTFVGTIEILDTWRDPETNKAYALARMPIKIVPAK